jgi:hypothetical protein
MKRCPECGTPYKDIYKYCTKCGAELETDLKFNRCSQRDTPECCQTAFNDDDMYCCFCGSPTTYALAKNKEN